MNKYWVIIYVLLCSSCTVSNETEKYQRSRKNIIHVGDKVKEIKMEEPLISSLNRLYLMDSYVIIQDMKSLDKLIHLFDRNNFEYIAGFADRGQGPGEIANMGLLAVDEPRRTFYVSDHGKNKIFAYHLDSVLHDSTYEPKVKAVMNEAIFPDYYQIVNDSMAICRIIQPVGNNDFKTAAGKMNIETGEITLMKYENPKITGKKRSSIAASPEHKLYVEYYHNCDLMTICNFDGDLICNVYGPTWGNRHNNRYYYDNAVFCGDRIYANYSGEDRPNGDTRVNRTTRILVFDLQGNYIQTLETGLHTKDFCYDRKNNRLLFSLDDDIQFGYLALD
jgi:hypothetical protein